MIAKPETSLRVFFFISPKKPISIDGVVISALIHRNYYMSLSDLNSRSEGRRGALDVRESEKFVNEFSFHERPFEPSLVLVHYFLI